MLAWDGDKVSGTINPGADAINLPSVAVDVTTIKIEADTYGQKVTVLGDVAGDTITVAGLR